MRRPSALHQLLVPTLFLLAGCVGGPGATAGRGSVDAVFAVPTVRPEGAAPAAQSARGAQAFAIGLRFVRRGGDPLSAPLVVVLPRQRANVSVVDQTALVEGFDVQSQAGAVTVDPNIGIVESGVSVDLCAAAVDDDAVLAYHARLADLQQPIPVRTLQVTAASPPVSIQLPKVESCEAGGVRRVTLGRETLLATLGTGPDAVDLYATVHAAPIDPPNGAEEPGAEEAVVEEDVPPLSAWLDGSGAEVRIDVDALVLREALPVGEVRAATTLDVRPLRSMSVTTRPQPGAGVSVSLDEAYVRDFDGVTGGFQTVALQPKVDHVRSGVSLDFTDGGAVEVRWATVPRWGSFTTRLTGGAGNVPVRLDLPDASEHVGAVPVVPGTWLVPLARTEDGGTLAFRVAIAPVPGGQRRVASQTQATSARAPSGVSVR